MVREGDLETLAGLVFLRKTPVCPVGDVSFDIDMGLGFDLILGVETSLEAEISLGEDFLPDKFPNSPDMFGLYLVEPPW